MAAAGPRLSDATYQPGEELHQLLLYRRYLTLSLILASFDQRMEIGL